MEWQPLEEPLRQLAGYLKDSLSGHDQNAQKHATLVGQHPSLAGRSSLVL
jgi:transportin-1